MINAFGKLDACTSGTQTHENSWEIDVFKMVQKVMKNAGGIDAFNSGPEK